MKRAVVVGIWILSGAMVAAGLWAGAWAWRWSAERAARQAWIADCVRSIPGYLDAEEIWRQEQECRVGIRLDRRE